MSKARGKKAAAVKPVDSGEIIVTTQQSRFRNDAIDAPESKEIDIKDLTVSIGGKDVLDHAELRIKDGGHYVLVGRNGTGKSTLLRALAEGRVPGIAWNMRMLLLGQTLKASNIVEDAADGKAAAKTVLEHVVTSNAERERALADEQLLAKALDNANDPTAAVKAVRQLKLKRLERTLTEARMIASRRSGTRGLKARKEVNSLEEQFETAMKITEEEGANMTADDIHAESQEAAQLLSDIRTSLELMDAATAESRARTILLGLGFTVEAIEKPFTSLSGGWRTRCELACALAQKADVLMLDEPTNFLDLPAVIWLQDYITALDSSSVIVVTHDRDFADAVGDELIILREKKLEKFKGNLSAFEKEKLQQIKRLTRMKEAQDKKVAHMENTIAQNIQAAKRTGDDKKLKQAASRRKKIDERTGMEVNAKGGRFKLNRDLAGYHYSNRDEIEIPEMDPPVTILLPASPDPLRFPGPIVSCEKMTFAYPAAGKRPGTGPAVLTDIDLIIHEGERVGIAGLNGSGKSTLVKLIMASNGGDSTLKPRKGSITVHSRARIACFSQHEVELLEERGVKEPTLTALAYFLAEASGHMTEQEARGLLGSLGLRGKTVSDVPILNLSGGQKVRLALARCIWDSPHLLVLDEVTTHLDFDTIVGLVEGFESWTGALLVVTHDRYFMRCVVEGEPAREDDEDEGESERDDAKPGVVYWMKKSGLLKKLEGGMNQYEEIARRSIAKLQKSGPG